MFGSVFMYQGHTLSHSSLLYVLHVPFGEALLAQIQRSNPRTISGGSFFSSDTGTCGFGDTFCGSDCVSQCDAKLECSQYAVPAGKTCPLNVCCSAYGFCGTTAEFCNTSQGCQSNCGSPAVPPGKSSKPVTNKVIGYYKAW